ncbi:MAG: tRNA (adenosine(37)-N6)-dimethylallyltransferase MiaA [Clostridiales bacterium]|nr:tRNA (adenosine(37)-N6)-dimethylallyltransferase MiaA [Clostridiales bacterium]
MIPLIILSGPTAVGKTKLSIELARSLNAEIISADSMQVYRGMDIGTAKITADEMEGIRHHLIDIISPFDEWNVTEFVKRSKEAINEIVAGGKVPIVTGGTGFYIQALIKDVDFSNEEDTSVRDELIRTADEKGSEFLYQMLREVDPESAEIIHKNNLKRVIRALEFFRLHGKKISEHNKEQTVDNSPYNYLYFVLNDERSRLYERIDRRVDTMIDNGLVDEVASLRNRGLDLSYVSMQGLGYKEIYRYLSGEITLDEAVYILKRDTRHFAKRQLTWFKREENVIMFDKSRYNNDNEILNEMVELYRRKISGN